MRGYKAGKRTIAGRTKKRRERERNQEREIERETERWTGITNPSRAVTPARWGFREGVGSRETNHCRNNKERESERDGARDSEARTP